MGGDDPNRRPLICFAFSRASRNLINILCVLFSRRNVNFFFFFFGCNHKRTFAFSVLVQLGADAEVSFCETLLEVAFYKGFIVFEHPCNQIARGDPLGP